MNEIYAMIGVLTMKRQNIRTPMIPTAGASPDNAWQNVAVTIIMSSMPSVRQCDEMQQGQRLSRTDALTTVKIGEAAETELTNKISYG